MSEEYIIPSIKKYKICELIINEKKFDIYCENIENIKDYLESSIHKKYKEIKLKYIYSTDSKKEAEKMAVDYKEVLK